MRTHRWARLRVLLTLTLAALAVLAVLLFRGRPQAHKEALKVTARRRTTAIASRPNAATARAAAAHNPQALSQAALDRMLGQMIVATFAGNRPSGSFLERIREGQIGGVILFADNLNGGPAAIRDLTQELQSAARQGGNPPLLIMTDQEGGTVSRIAGPPSTAASDMSTTAIAYGQGKATGVLLRSLGINVDLAPVADVAAASGSFLGTRAFGTSPALVADHACAFAAGLAAEHVGYTLKHFPGLGMATTSTDYGPVVIDAPAAALRADYLAYTKCANSALGMVMVSSAIYPSLTGPLPAVMSRVTYDRELPTAAPQGSVPTISDDLQTPAFVNQSAPARTAIDAGLDMVMYAETEDGSAGAYQALTEDIADGRITAERLREANNAILQLKHAVAGS